MGVMGKPHAKGFADNKLQIWNWTNSESKTVGCSGLLSNTSCEPGTETQRADCKKNSDLNPSVGKEFHITGAEFLQYYQPNP